MATELNFMRYWSESLLPSLEQLAVTEEELADVTMPVLVIHGTKDRSVAYGGGREWALRLTNARLLTVEKRCTCTLDRGPRGGRWPNSEPSGWGMARGDGGG